MGKAKPYMIHSLTDETYAVNNSLEMADDEKRKIIIASVITGVIHKWKHNTFLSIIVGTVVYMVFSKRWWHSPAHRKSELDLLPQK